jgi:serine/threonine protein kinase
VLAPWVLATFLPPFALPVIITLHLLLSDIKPGNVLFVERGKQWVLKLADFGLSRLRLPGDEQDMTVVIGTPQYAPPELLKVFSLRCVFTTIHFFDVTFMLLAPASLLTCARSHSVLTRGRRTTQTQ